MQQMVLAATFALLSVVWWPTPYALAQEAKVVRGIVTNVSGTSLTASVKKHDMKFAIETSTHVEAPGAGTKTRAAVAAGQKGPSLSDIVRVGDSVAITYHDLNGALQASHVRVVQRPATGSMWNAGSAGHSSGW